MRRDHRSAAQRNHDGFLAGMRGLIASGELGQHNGLPVSIIVTTTLQGPRGRHRQSPDRRGHPGAHVGCDPLGQPRPSLPGDLRSRQAPGAVSHQAAGLPGAANHAATPRIVDAPCPAATPRPTTARSTTSKAGPGTHRTDINELTLACGPDNRLAEKGWTTRKNAKGDTEWLPPPHLDYGRPRTNTFHHPEKTPRRPRRRRTRLTPGKRACSTCAAPPPIQPSCCDVAASYDIASRVERVRCA